MSTYKKGKSSPKGRKSPALSSPTPSSLFELLLLEPAGIPDDCPARNCGGIAAMKERIVMPNAIPDSDIPPLHAEGCYTCAMVAHCYPLNQWQRCLLARGPRLMVDTLSLRFPMRLEEDQMAGWMRTMITKEDGYNVCSHQKLYRLDNDSTIHLSYYRNTYREGPSLFIRFSLPRVLHGSNLILAPGIEQAMLYVKLLLNSIPDLPELDPWQAILSELHVMCNFPVGGLIPYYVKALFNLVYPHRKPSDYPSQGVMFKSGQSKCNFYDKGIESGNPAAYGLLRQESQLHSKAIKNAIKDHTGQEKWPNLRDVTEGLMHYILQKDQIALRIHDRPFGTFDMTRKVLCDKYGFIKGMRLYGILLTLRELGSKEQIAQEIGCSPRVWQKAIKAIADAGIAPALTDAPRPLPPLTLPQPHG